MTRCRLPALAVLALLSLVLLVPAASAARPVISVTTPKAHRLVHPGFLVSGTANVFEAQLELRLYRVQGGHRTLLLRTYTMASCGTGCWGHYAKRLRYHLARPALGLLLVSDSDAAGVGHPPHTVALPLRLAAG